MMSIALVACIVSGSAGVAPADELPPTLRAPLPIPTTKAVDELIPQLPPARAEWAIDPTTGLPIESPVVTALQGVPLTPAQLGEVLRITKSLRTPTRWFKDKPYAVWLRTPSWLCGYEIMATPRIPSGQPARAVEFCAGCGVGEEHRARWESHQIVGTLPPGTREVAFDVRASSLRGGPTWTGTITALVELIEPLEAVPDASDDLTKAVRASLRPRVLFGTYPFASTALPPARLCCERIGPTAEFTPTHPLADAVAVARVELLREGKAITWIVSRDLDESGDEGLGWIWGQEIFGETAKALADPAREAEFSIRVSGVKPDYISRWCRTRYWAGEFTVPLKDCITRKEPWSPKDKR